LRPPSVFVILSVAEAMPGGRTRKEAAMKRITATILLTLGLVLGPIIGLAGSAGAQTPKYGPDCYPGSATSHLCSAPARHIVVHPRTAATHHTAKPSTTSTPSKSSPTPVLVDSQSAVSSQLAFTGLDVAAFVIVGLALVGGGLILVRVTRRRRVA
jgi:hypothetical protein